MFEPPRNRMRLLLSVFLTLSMVGAGLPVVFAATPESPQAVGPRATNDGKDLIVPDGDTLELSGTFTYTRSVQINGILTVKSYNGADESTGTLSITAPSITIGANGKVVADGRGFGGGGGGQNSDQSVSGGFGGKEGVGGKGQDAYWSWYGWGAASYFAGGGGGGSPGGKAGETKATAGTDTAGGKGGDGTGGPGGNGGTGYGSGGGGGGGNSAGGGGGGGGGCGGKDAVWTEGGNGAGPFGGKGGTGTSGSPGPSNNAKNGGYMAAESNGDTSVDNSASKGDGGGGGGCSSSGGYGGGGGGGGAGGGAVVLIADGDLTMQGTITANGGGGGTAGGGGGSTAGLGGGGSGGGIVLTGGKVVLSGKVESQGKNGNTLSTTNGGTVKLFYGTLVGDKSAITAGRVYLNSNPTVKLVSPEQDTAAAKPLFKWTATDAERDPILGAHLMVAPTKDFASPVIDVKDIKGESYESPVTLIGVEFFWKVQARGAAGYGAWSETWRFLADNVPPITQVDPLPKFVSSQNFNVTWSGVDDMVGIQDYTIFFSDNGKPYEEWLNRTTLTTATFPGEETHKYRFYSVGRDKAENIEAIPDIPDVTTTVDSTPPKGMLLLNAFQKSTTFVVNWTATDATSGVSNYTLLISDNGGVPRVWLTNTTKRTEKYIGAERHDYKFYLRTRDVAGNVEEQTTDNTKPTRVDFAPPQTALTLNGVTFGSKPTYITPLTTITLTAKDDNAVNATLFTIDSDPLQRYTFPLNRIYGGSHNLTYWTNDVAGNEEKRSVFWFFVDGDAPLTTLTYKGSSFTKSGIIYVAANTLIVLDTQDAGSGNAATTYHFDNYDTILYSDPFTIEMTGSHTLYFSSVDNLGNAETARVQKVMLDKTPPVTIAVAPVVPQREDFTVKLRGSDMESGAAATYYRIMAPGGSFEDWQIGSEFDIAASSDHSADGTYTIEYYSVDNVGNVEGTRTVRATMDTLSSLTLNIKGSETSDKSTFILRGQAEPGSRVSVNNLMAQVSPDGYFTFDIELKEGTNRVVVVSTDAAGNTEQLSRTIDYNPSAQLPEWQIWAIGIAVVSIAAAAVTVLLTRGGKRATA